MKYNLDIERVDDKKYIKMKLSNYFLTSTFNENLGVEDYFRKQC